jgi:hypothetical protein
VTVVAPKGDAVAGRAQEDDIADRRPSSPQKRIDNLSACDLVIFSRTRSER